ncbi:desampylase [Salinigranum halophilum]|uniref:desampylase n=1 Tax=Salinigranum halophilum TaxID=2565931 RepID=UPI00115DEC39|nr:desampylase [Salinigranum halophilum]
MTSPDLVFETALAERLLDHARAGAPAEVCGVLGGSEGTVTHAEPVSNIASTPRTRYELDPAETVEAIERVEAGAEHLGFYHSHPQGPPRPSATDEAEATWPDAVYCIVSLPESRIRAWRWTGDRFDELRVETG